MLLARPLVTKHYIQYHTVNKVPQVVFLRSAFSTRRRVFRLEYGFPSDIRRSAEDGVEHQGYEGLGDRASRDPGRDGRRGDYVPASRRGLRGGGIGDVRDGVYDAIRNAVAEVRSHTDRPFAVNLFVPEDFDPSLYDPREVNAPLARYREELGIEAPEETGDFVQPFEDQLAVVLEEKVPVFSFTFGVSEEA
jgi:hypothetical protein